MYCCACPAAVLLVCVGQIQHMDKPAGVARRVVRADGSAVVQVRCLIETTAMSSSRQASPPHSNVTAHVCGQLWAAVVNCTCSIKCCTAILLLTSCILVCLLRTCCLLTVLLLALLLLVLLLPQVMLLSDINQHNKLLEWRKAADEAWKTTGHPGWNLLQDEIVS